jgi:hypothetical protein
MIRKSLFLAVALILPAAGAFAQAPASSTGISWSYFDFGYQRFAPDADALDDSNGFAIRGSGAINENWHVFLGWNRGKIEGEGVVTDGTNTGIATVDDDLDRFNIGIGYNLPVAATTDLFARVGYERLGSIGFDVVPDIAPPGTPALEGKLDSLDGYSVEVGVRSAFTPRFEAGGSLRYIGYDDPDARVDGVAVTGLRTLDGSVASLLLYGQYKFGNGWGAVAEADINSEYNSFFLGARLSY